MNISHIGKFEMRSIISEFDETLINLFGMNMLDASISRFEALNAYEVSRCPRKAAEVLGLQIGLKPQGVLS